LDALFERRWQVVQRAAVEQVLVCQIGSRDKAVVAHSDQPPDLAGLDAEFRDTFAGYGLAVADLPPAEAARRVEAARIRAALVDGLTQWLLVAGDAARLLELLE